MTRVHTGGRLAGRHRGGGQLRRLQRNRAAEAGPLRAAEGSDAAAQPGGADLRRAGAILPAHSSSTAHCLPAAREPPTAVPYPIVLLALFSNVRGRSPASCMWSNRLGTCIVHSCPSASFISPATPRSPRPACRRVPPLRPQAASSARSQAPHAEMWACLPAYPQRRCRA